MLGEENLKRSCVYFFLGFLFTFFPFFLKTLSDDSLEIYFFFLFTSEEAAAPLFLPPHLLLLQPRPPSPARPRRSHPRALGPAAAPLPARRRRPGRAALNSGRILRRGGLLRLNGLGARRCLRSGLQGAAARAVRGRRRRGGGAAAGLSTPPACASGLSRQRETAA